jgi:hypothetical protein
MNGIASYDSAFAQGYRDCNEAASSSAATSLTSSHFNPPAEFREAYQLGWDKASLEIGARLQRSERRWDVLGPLLLGLFLLGSGVGITAFTIRAQGSSFVIAYGAIISGLLSIAKGALTFFRRSPS